MGNSQWQREGRKLGAAKIGVPFIYQTFYAGRDESQDKIREPSSLQVYNQLVYSVRYKVPSFVSYFENNFDNSQTRERIPLDSKKLLSKYLKATIIYDVNKTIFSDKRELEKEFYFHMINYIKEPKYIDLHKSDSKPRIVKDLTFLTDNMYDLLINRTEKFINELLDYIYESNPDIINEYLDKLELVSFDSGKFELWTSYDNKPNIKGLINYLKLNDRKPLSYVRGSSKVGLVDTDLCKKFLTAKFPNNADKINIILDSKYTETLLMPLRIHKLSNGSLKFSPDPESGEIVAFSELFGYDLRDNKSRPVIGYCIVDTPSNFKIEDKIGTKLYKALAEYIDILIINDKDFITDLNKNYEYEDHEVLNLESTKPNSLTEEMAVVSTFLNQTTIISNWKLCFIHTHHSSWQQLVIYDGTRIIQEKIDRVSTKVDLITQKEDLFMIAEGKNTYMDILKDGKIQKAMEIAGNKIDSLLKKENRHFDAFVYNLLTIPSKDPDFFVEREAETVSESIKKGHFNNIAFHEYFVVIVVYLDEKCSTKFKLIYSPDFNSDIKELMDKEFNQ